MSEDWKHMSAAQRDPYVALAEQNRRLKSEIAALRVVVDAAREVAKASHTKDETRKHEAWDALDDALGSEPMRVTATPGIAVEFGRASDVCDMCGKPLGECVGGWLP